MQPEFLTTKCFHEITSPIEDRMDCSAEDGSYSSVIPAPGGNPGLFSGRISLDTRPSTPLRTCFRGYDERRYLLQLSAPLFSKETRRPRSSDSSSNFSFSYLRDLRAHSWC